MTKYIGKGAIVAPIKDSQDWITCGFFAVYDYPLSYLLKNYDELTEIECKGNIVGDGDDFYQEGVFALHPNDTIIRCKRIKWSTYSHLIVPKNWKELLEQTIDTTV